jgi:hypothetical protein
MGDKEQVYVTLDWAGEPITTMNGLILPRHIEEKYNAKYYPKKVRGEWPCDPDTGELLPIYYKPAVFKRHWISRLWFFIKLKLF